MQVTGQNLQQKVTQQPQHNVNYNSGYVSYPSYPIAQQQTQVYQPPQPVAQHQMAATPQVTQNSQSIPPQYQPQYCAPQYAQYPQYQPQQNSQNLQIPASTSGVNIQIFNPSVSTPGSQPATYNVNAPCYPSNYYTGQMGIPNNVNQNSNTQNTQNTQETKSTKETTTKEEKKTEKKKIVQLTDDYIRNLENYLNSQDKEVRLSAAKEVYARLEEDDTRKDDKALTALVNKMLQDPADEIRLLALTALESRIVTGDDFTVGVLKQMQNAKTGYGQDAADASRILLLMSGKQVEKEVPIKETKKKEETKENNSSSSKKV